MNLNSDKKPAISPAPNGPYLVTGLEDLLDSKGQRISTKASFALCRCGGSSNKPFCDGTHATIGFSSEKRPERTPDNLESYPGEEGAVHDNRGICAHAGHCTNGLPEVFRLRKEPWIDPDGAEPEEIAKTVEHCPSGALGYSIGGRTYGDQERPPSVLVTKNGPYAVTGGVPLSEVEWAEGASREHYTLCRCGASKNKPFCDGSHWDIDFDDGS